MGPREGVIYEADQRRAEILVRDLGLQSGSKSVLAPGVKEGQPVEQTETAEVYATKFRALVARANDLAQGRGDIQYAVKDLCRTVSKPEERYWTALKRLG